MAAPSDRSPTCIAIDWSGDATAAGQRRKIVAATVRDGRVTNVTAGRTRADVAEWLHTGIDRSHPTFIGLDFSFSVPEWFARSLGATSVDAVWAVVAERAERWLRECAPPFWGRTATRATLEVADRYRECERQLRDLGRQPKSIFQIGGPGAVGTGSLRGMPWLAWLRERGFAIWPFDALGTSTALEVYPSLYAKVATNDADGRVAHLDPLPSNVLGPMERAAAIAGDDAFDAVVSALAMWDRRSDLAALKPATDVVARLEGAIWR